MCEFLGNPFWILKKFVVRSHKSWLPTRVVCLSSHVSSTFPLVETSFFTCRNLCLCSLGITPWNCTCRILDSWPLERKQKQNKRHASCGFVIFVTWNVVLLCIVTFFFRERSRQRFRFFFVLFVCVVGFSRTYIVVFKTSGK